MSVNLKTVDYNYFLEHRTEKRNCNVLIVCKECNKESVVSWNSLQTRQHKYEAICNKCINKYVSHKTLHGSYYGIKFESSYELGFIHHCIKNNIPIKRCDVQIPYLTGNESHFYYPDFIVNNSIIEIKGKIDEWSKIKSLAAKDFCSKHNMNYQFLTLKDLKRMRDFIHVTNQENLIFFDNAHLMITSMPQSWNNELMPKNDSIGFAYVITNLLTDFKICDYVITKDFSQKFIDSLINKNEKIDILGYSNNEYELLKITKRFGKIRNDVKFKRKNNVRSKEECLHQSKIKQEAWKNMTKKEREFFKQKMSKAVTGEKNPNYGNKWTDEQKKALSKKRIKNGKTRGKLNGMHGKKGEKSINGYHINVYDKNMKFVKTFLSIVALENEFSLTKQKIKNAINEHLLVKDHYFEWTEDTKNKIEHWKKSTTGEKNGMFNKKGENAVNGVPVKVFNEENELIYEFKTNNETCEKLNMTHYRLEKCVKTGETYRGMIFKKGSRNYTEKSFPCKHSKTCYKFDHDGNIVKTYRTKTEMFDEFKKLKISKTKAMNHKEINGFFYSLEPTFNQEWIEHNN